MAVAVAALSGCATTKGPSDEELIAGVLEQWKTGFVEQNIEKIVATYSETFTNPEVPDKAGLQEFLEGAVDMGYLEDVEVATEDTDTVIEGTTATIYPIDLTSAAGSVTIELTLAKEEAGWLITGMDIEGL
ncbi:MAG: hypothetical protein QG656_1420 [Candidatus Hydrogenedentes bacterium]|nr:hypothetical protein [Candidatus Hydrogenedentota bacterium]